MIEQARMIMALVGIGAALVAGAEPSEAMTPGEGASQKANALPRLVV